LKKGTRGGRILVAMGSSKLVKKNRGRHNTGEGKGVNAPYFREGGEENTKKEERRRGRSGGKVRRGTKVAKRLVKFAAPHNT